MIAPNNRTNGECNDLELVRKGAYRGARKLLRYRNEHLVCVDIASGAAEAALQSEKPIKNPEAWGRKYGYWKAASFVRKCIAERRYKKHKAQTGASFSEDTSFSVERNDLARSVARKTLELLSTKDALYVLSSLLCDCPIEEIGAIVDQIEDVARPKKAHDKQLAAAVRKLQIHLQC